MRGVDFYGFALALTIVAGQVEFTLAHAFRRFPRTFYTPTRPGGAASTVGHAEPNLLTSNPGRVQVARPPEANLGSYGHRSP
ncbi:hypothetical protein GCM10007079_13710 [Nocardiopsis terrae]|nr:hypothetical protein GCM10007079_13710 [Nocardiopsis terrae]